MAEAVYERSRKKKKSKGAKKSKKFEIENELVKESSMISTAPSLKCEDHANVPSLKCEDHANDSSSEIKSINLVSLTPDQEETINISKSVEMNKELIKNDPPENALLNQSIGNNSTEEAKQSISESIKVQAEEENLIRQNIISPSAPSIFVASEVTPESNEKFLTELVPMSLISSDLNMAASDPLSSDINQESSTDVLKTESIKEKIISEVLPTDILEKYVSSKDESSIKKSVEKSLDKVNYLAVKNAEVAAVHRVKEVFSLHAAKEMNMEPFTEEQLTSFYYNPEISQIDLFVGEFLKNSNKEQHKFYELVDFYFKSRNKVADLQHRIKLAQEKVDEDQKKLWEIRDFTYTVEGKCGCGVSVLQQHRYQKAFFHQKQLTQLSSNMLDLREIVHEHYQLQEYNSQVGKLHVENYIYKLFKMEPALCNVSDDRPVSVYLPCDLTERTITTLCNLQDCISILFSFLRIGCVEEEFNKDINRWLDLMVSSLQRIGTLPDHFFLLNHLIRCPCGVPSIKAQYIQFPTFNAHQLLSVWKRPQVHHFVVMLTTLTLPVRARAEFLSKFKVNYLKTIKRHISWTLVDEDSYEDENRDDIWSLMTEQDLISLFAQFPFSDLFFSLLNIDPSQDKMNHLPTSTSSLDMMSLLAFSSLLIKLLGQIFDTYNLLRYRQFIKHVSRTIRLVAQIVSDQWVAYHKYQTEVIKDTPQDYPKMSETSGFNLARLQLEFDQFLLRAFNIIISSKCFGSMQFLSTMPFDAISSSAMWMLLNMLISQQTTSEIIKSNNILDLPNVTSLEISPNDCVFLLTAISNIALSRTKEDQMLIEACMKVIIELSFLNPTVEKLYAKNGQDLLALISNKHPFLTSSLITMVSKILKQLDEHLVNIFNALHLHLWLPQIADFDIIRTWLMDSPLTSTESRLARILLSGINYGIGQVDNALFLPRSYHYLVAILLVESYGILFPNNPGGIQQLNYSSMGIIEQVSQIAISSYNKVVYYQVHSEFIKWAWKVLLMLKLHESDILKDVSEECSNFAIGSSSWANNLIQQLENKHSYDFDIQTTPVLTNVLRASASQGSLAAYVIFAMTKYGHLLDVFVSKGLPYVSQLSNANEYDAVLRIISNLSVLFVQHPERLATESYLKMLLCSIHIDVGCAGYTEKLWQYFVVGAYSQTFAALVTSHILKSKDHSDAHLAIKFWMQMLTKIPFWSRDYSVLFQMDNLCKVAFSVHNGLSLVCDLLFDEYKKFIKLNEPRGILSSVMSWVSSNQLISFMPTATTNFCYFAFVVLMVERKYEKSIGLWKMLSVEMLINLSMIAEQAYKKVSVSLKTSYLPPFYALSIYRWGEQAMLTPSSHPFLPIIWQQFFVIFLKKPKCESSFPSRSGIGNRFYQSTTFVSTLKSMKSALFGFADYHKKMVEGSNQVDKNDSVSGEPQTTVEYNSNFHSSLVILYQSFALWVDESRLHDSNLYLGSLPEVYKCDLLVKIFNGNKDLWLEFVDKEKLQKELQMDFSFWRNTIYAPSKSLNTAQIVSDVLMQSDVYQRIIKRLIRETKPLPPLQIIKPSSPIKEVSQHLLLIEPQLMQDIYHDIGLIVQLSKSSAALAAKHVGMDCSYLELVPDLYEMVVRKVTVGIPCDGQRRKKKGGCTSPAQAVIQYNELQLREQIRRILEDNRAACDKLLQLSISQINENLCKAVVRLECVIEILSDAVSSPNETKHREVIDSAGRLFYSLAQLVDIDIKRSPPAIQFFSSALENLGKTFIANNPKEQHSLLNTVLGKQDLIVFLGHHFRPMADVHNFTTLYSKLVTHINADCFTTVFVLLSKFDINAWLDCSPPASERLTMVMVMMVALKNLGVQPNSEATVVFEILRKQIAILFSSGFNSYFSKVLVELLNFSSATSISAVFWSDFVGFVQTSIAQGSLSTEQLKESVHYLISYFQNETYAVGCHLDDFYNIWSIYIESLSLLLKTLLMTVINDSFKDCGDLERLIKNNWDICCSLYQPWLVPQSKGKIWSLLRTDLVLFMIKSFTECIQLLTVPSKNGYCSVLNYIWNFYYHAIVPAVTEKQSLDLFHSILIMLPWYQMYPSLEELDQILQSHISYPPAFPFFVELFFNINLKNVVSSYAIFEAPNDMGQFHQILLNIFVVMATNQEIAFSSNKIKEVFQDAKKFYWNFMVLEQTARSCQWFAETADSSTVLDHDSLTWSMISLLEVVCGYHSDDIQFPSDEFIIAKRNIFIQVIVTLISRCSLNMAPTLVNYRFVITKLLSSIESILVYNVHENTQMQELVIHCSTAFHLLNSISSSEVFAVIKETIQNYLQGTKSQLLVLSLISAASRSIASQEHLIAILEISIESYFSKLFDDKVINSWLQVYQTFIIPELNIEEFLKEALKQSAFLTLYTYNLHLISHTQSTGEYLILLGRIVQLCSKPTSPTDCETKFLLLWLQIFDIVRLVDPRVLNKNQQQQLEKQLNLLSIICQSKSEEKIYSGVLGVLGVGRKSTLSKEFRLSAKAVHLFLVNKMISQNDVNHSTAGRTPSDPEKAFASFYGLLKNKAYEDFRDQTQWILQFVSNPLTTIEDGCSLVAYLCQHFFTKYSYIVAAIT